MKIALIGGGEVGRCYARALYEAGQNVYLIVDNHPTEILEDFCSELGAAFSSEPSAALAEADLILCAVFGAITLDIAKSIKPFLKQNSLYADLTTGRPSDILEASAELEKRQIRFVDVAIAGAISVQKEKTPLLLAGKNAADFLPIANQLNAPAKIVGKEAGAAVSLKLLRSIFTKGCEALAVECFAAAEQKGLREELYEVLSDIDDRPISVFLEACVNSHAVHARRRLVEVGEAMEQMKDLDLEPIASRGVEALFRNTVKQLDARPFISGSFDENLEWLKESLRFSKTKEE